MASKTFRLRHLTPSHLTTILASPQPGAKSLLDGIDGIRTDDLRHEVTFSGKPEAVRGMEQLAAMLDKRPQVTVVHLRLVHSERLLDGEGIDWRFVTGLKGSKFVAVTDVSRNAEPTVTVIGEAKVRASNNSSVSASMFGREQIVTVVAKPHINGDRTVSLALEISENGAEAYVAFRRLREDRVLLLAGGFTQNRRDGGLYLFASVSPAR